MVATGFEEPPPHPIRLPVYDIFEYRPPVKANAEECIELYEEYLDRR